MKTISNTSNSQHHEETGVHMLSPVDRTKNEESVKNIDRRAQDLMIQTICKTSIIKEEGSEIASGTGTPEHQLSFVSSHPSESSSSYSQEEVKSKEFSSLLFLSKRLNEENRIEECSNISKDIELEFQDALKYTLNSTQIETEKLSHYEEMSIEESLGFIATRTQEFNENQFECIGVLKYIHKKITNRPLVVDKNDNIFLSINLENDEDRELIVTLSKIKLPELYCLKIENFYEADEDLENFIDNSIKSVRNFMFYSESYCVDLHDYLEKILKIPYIKHLHLRGFMIDSDDNQCLLSSCSIEAVSFVSCNLSIEEDFTIKHKQYFKDRLCSPILSKIELFDNEIDEEAMGYLLNAISKSKLKDTLKHMMMKNCLLTCEEVQSSVSSLGLNIQVV